MNNKKAAQQKKISDSILTAWSAFAASLMYAPLQSTFSSVFNEY